MFVKVFLSSLINSIMYFIAVLTVHYVDRQHGLKDLVKIGTEGYDQKQEGQLELPDKK
jgi:hypothetical protein